MWCGCVLGGVEAGCGHRIRWKFPGWSRGALGSLPLSPFVPLAMWGPGDSSLRERELKR